MQEVLKVKKAGAGSAPADDAPPETIQDGPIAFSGDQESTPPDIIIEK
jgi:hypothetical protein